MMALLLLIAVAPCILARPGYAGHVLRGYAPHAVDYYVSVWTGIFRVWELLCIVFVLL